MTNKRKPKYPKRRDSIKAKSYTCRENEQIYISNEHGVYILNKSSFPRIE